MRGNHKRNVLWGIFAGALCSLAAWTQTWFVFSISEGATTSELSVPGTATAPLVSPISLVALAGVGVLLIAQRVVRWLVLVVVIVLGVCGDVSLWFTFANPIASSLNVLSKVTGISDITAVSASVTETATTGWIWVAALGFLIVSVSGAGGLLGSRQWGSPSTRFTRPEKWSQSSRVEKPITRDNDSWETLSRGEDPTSDLLG